MNEPIDRDSLSLFDLDSTLYRGVRGYVILDLVPFLASHGVLDGRVCEAMDRAERSYRETRDRDVFAREANRMFYAGLRDQAVAELDRLYREFWSQRRPRRWFRFTRPLIAILNRYQTTRILISGSPVEALRLMPFQRKFDRIYGSEGDANGCFLGTCRELASLGAKVELLGSLATEIPYQRAKSFAFGDSVSDIPLLEAVDHGFVIRGREVAELESYARERKMPWTFLDPLHDDVVAKVEERARDVLTPRSPNAKRG